MQTPKAGPPITADNCKRKILIVDDHMFNIESIKILLQCKVHLDVDSVCDSANNGEEALELIRHDVQHMHKGKFCSYALILLDC